jgi:hypothetical protein
LEAFWAGFSKLWLIDLPLVNPLLVYLIISISFFTLGYKSETFRSYEISMLFGISWQIFTLTHPGALFIGKMNDTFRLGKEVHK